MPGPVLGAGWLAGWLAARVVETGCWAPVLRACCARGGDRVPVLCARCVLRAGCARDGDMVAVLGGCWAPVLALVL